MTAIAIYVLWRLLYAYFRCRLAYGSLVNYLRMVWEACYSRASDPMRMLRMAWEACSSRASAAMRMLRTAPGASHSTAPANEETEMTYGMTAQTYTMRMLRAASEAAEDQQVRSELVRT